MKHIVRTQDFDKEWLEKTFFPTAERMEYALRTKTSLRSTLDGRQALLLFWEPSSRTVSRFNIAGKKLGMDVTIMLGKKGDDGKSILQYSSEVKGESFEDTVRTFAGHGYDFIIIRTPQEGLVEEAADVIDEFGHDTHIINAGDGPGQHPTQALLDLYTIKKDFEKIDGLNCALIGDLKGSRVMHSLAYILSRYDVQMTFMSPKGLEMPTGITDRLNERHRVFEAYNITGPAEMFDKIKHADFWYVVRYQKERHEQETAYNLCLDEGIVLTHLKAGGKIYHPLPRKEEIPAWPHRNTIDKLPCAGYFDQVKNGVPVSMALYEILARQENAPQYYIRTLPNELSDTDDYFKKNKNRITFE